MRIVEIIYPLFEPLFEMAFERKAIIDRLRSYQDQINLHALKIIIWPDAQEVPHWKREVIALGNGLTFMRLHMRRRLRPMGFGLAWKHLYQEPFEYGETEGVQVRLTAIQEEYTGRPVAKPIPQIVAELTTFLRALCQAIGQGQPVGAVVNILGAQPISHE